MSIKILNEFPGEIEVKNKWNDDTDSLDAYDSLLDMMTEGEQEAGSIGPFAFELIASEGGEGQGESACRVYKFTDTRDGSVQYIGIVGSYYSYNGYEWDGAEPMLCTIEDRVVSKVISPRGRVITEITNA